MIGLALSFILQYFVDQTRRFIPAVIQRNVIEEVEKFSSGQVIQATSKYVQGPASSIILPSDAIKYDQINWEVRNTRHSPWDNSAAYVV